MENNTENKIEISKSFPVSAKQLYNAWTNPEELKKWWKPLEKTLADVTNDLKKGGQVKYLFEGNSLLISGEYLEVQEPEKLEYTWNWDFPEEIIKNAEYKLTVIFKGSEGGSTISVTQENFKDDETMKPHRDGWEKGLSDLAQYLGGNDISSTNGQTTEGTADSTGGYREAPEQQKVAGG